jgi:RsiW-degrading membrane proteinase PrsW (M82 family)
MNTTIGFFLSILFGFLPMFLFAIIIYWIDRYEKEPLLLLVSVFLWGAFIAAGGAFLVNTILGIGVFVVTASESITDLTTGGVIAPIVEESLKGFAVLIVFLLFRREFDSILDGIVYAAIAALGFAATENAYYIYQYGFVEAGVGGLLWLVFVRVILVGWQHPFYTSFTGIGLAVSRLNRSCLVKIIAPIIGFSIAIFAHSMHNFIASLLGGGGGLILGTLVDWTGWMVMFFFILWALFREQRWISTQLREEVNLGILSLTQYKVACSAWAQTRVRIQALFSGHYRATSRFYQVTAELAFKKQQLVSLGDESGNLAIINRYRAELARLAPQAVS